MTDFSADKLRPALRDAFLLLDRMAGEGLGYDGEGIKLDADDVCLALSEVLGATWEEGPFAFADGATAAILAMAEDNRRMREAGNRLAFAAGALNIATDSAEHLTGERGNVLDALKGWESALGEEKS